MTGKTEEQLHKDAGTGFPFGDPEFIVEAAERAGFFLQREKDGIWVFKPAIGQASAADLRIMANELDNRNGVPVQSEAADEDGTYSIRGLSRRELLAITQLVGLSSGEDTSALKACFEGLGYQYPDDVYTVEAACNAAFPDFKVEASF